MALQPTFGRSVGLSVLVAVSKPDLSKPLRMSSQSVGKHGLRTSSETMESFDGGLGLLGRVIEVALVSSKEIHSSALSPAILHKRCRCTYWNGMKGLELGSCKEANAWEAMFKAQKSEANVQCVPLIQFLPLQAVPQDISKQNG